MTPYLIITGVEILERDLIIPSTIMICGIPQTIQGGLRLTLSIEVQGNGDLSEYITNNRLLNEWKILGDIINGKLKIKTVDEL